MPESHPGHQAPSGRIGLSAGCAAAVDGYAARPTSDPGGELSSVLSRVRGCMTELRTAAAQQRSEAAQTTLGSLYHRGEAGLPADCDASAKWYRAAAEQGNVEAHFMLGSMYHEGHGGLPQQPLEAYGWYLFAAEKGHEDSRAALLALETTLPAEQLAEAKRRAHELHGHHETPPSPAPPKPEPAPSRPPVPNGHAGH